MTELSAPTLRLLRTKIRTSLLSLAMCDALGAPAEFRVRGTFPLIDKMLPNNNFRLGPGHWTDDTTMALCLAQSMIDKGGQFDLLDQAKKYVAWADNGYLSSTGYCFDMGNATRMACGIWKRFGFTEYGLKEVQKSLNHERSSGNGSLMRVLPVALTYWNESEEEVLGKAAESSLTTHPNAVCQDACRVYVGLIRLILQNVKTGVTTTKDDLLGYLNCYEYKTIQIESTVGPISDFTAKEEKAISSSGYVVHSLQAALWAFFNTSSFEQGAIKVVNLGDDADTVAAIYGGIAGAWYADCDFEDTEGRAKSTFWSEKVAEWYNDLVKRELIEGIATGLWDLQENNLAAA